jgi:hypothetical protein
MGPAESQQEASMPDTRQGQGTTEQGGPRKQDQGTRRETEKGVERNPLPHKQGNAGSGTGRETTRQM